MKTVNGMAWADYAYMLAMAGYIDEGTPDLMTRAVVREDGTVCWQEFEPEWDSTRTGNLHVQRCTQARDDRREWRGKHHDRRSWKRYRKVQHTVQRGTQLTDGERVYKGRKRKPVSWRVQATPRGRTEEGHEMRMRRFDRTFRVPFWLKLTDLDRERAKRLANQRAQEEYRSPYATPEDALKAHRRRRKEARLRGRVRALLHNLRDEVESWLRT